MKHFLNVLVRTVVANAVRLAHQSPLIYRFRVFFISTYPKLHSALASFESTSKHSRGDLDVVFHAELGANGQRILSILESRASVRDTQPENFN